jgi:DNA invertase Pin-like site-specific DNA recombinase
MKIGYARVSTDEQNLDLQLHALASAGCEEVFQDQGLSGASAARPGLLAALERAGEGDTLTVWRIDRLGRSTLHLLQLQKLLRPDDTIWVHDYHFIPMVLARNGLHEPDGTVHSP